MSLLCIATAQRSSLTPAGHCSLLSPFHYSVMDVYNDYSHKLGWGWGMEFAIVLFLDHFNWGASCDFI